ncbi:MAG: RND family transporter [bacterium]
MSRRLDQLVVAYTQWVIRWRWLVVIAVLALAGLAASGGRFLYFNTSYRVFFSKDNPQLNAFEALQNIYTKNDNVLFVIEAKDGDIFKPRHLRAIEKLTEEGWKVPYAIRVDGVTNFQHTRAEEDDLIVEDLVYDAYSLYPEEIAARKAIALLEPNLRNRLISPKAHVMGVNVTVQLPGKDPVKEVPEVVDRVRTLAQAFREQNPDINLYLTGVVMLNNAFSEAGIRDLQTLVPAMYLLMFLIMLFILRSVTGTLATIIVIFLSTGTAMGLAGWLGIGLTAPSSQAATMIMTLAIADSIHILVTMLREMRRGLSKREAIVESLRVNFTPVFMTSFTTAIGFLSMNFSDSPPFWHLGNITATGVTAAFLYSVLLLPALIAILPVRVRVIREAGTTLFDRLAEFVIARRQALLWSSAALVLAISALIPQNILNDQFVKYFDQSIQFRRDTDFTTENLSGLYRIDFSVGAGESGGISNPEYLAKLEEFTEWYRQQPGVIHVSSFTEIMKRLNKSMHGDDQAYYRIPGSRELAAQYLLLYEMSLPYGLDLNNQINVSKSATRFNVTLRNVSSNQLRELAARGETWLRQNAPEYMFAHGVGPAVMFSHISARNIKSMLKGTVIALILISFSLIFALRSVKFGLLSLIPNLVPAAMAFGIWGALVGEINLALSMVMGMTLGIVVDDTIHFMSKYLRARREQKLSPQDAVRYAYSTVGLALVVTSVILVAGFTILAFSAFEMNAGMGKLTALTIILALLADFFFLPTLLMKAEEKAVARAEETEMKQPEAALSAT